MSDTTVATALRSSSRLVVVEAPAGCGKTFQGAGYASDVAGQVDNGRVLILAHTHAACDVFASRTRDTAGRVDIRTIDSLISQVATAYHLSLGLPRDTGAWARSRKNGYAELAAKVARLLQTSPIIARSIVQRYPILICDEHQDASADQHAITMACHQAGAKVRIFGDPMQRIYGGKSKAEIQADNQRWEALKQHADVFDQLDQPHRWLNGSATLGPWILNARAALVSGGAVDLRGTLPAEVSVIVAENQSPRFGGYGVAGDEGKPIYSVVNEADSLLILSAHNKTVHALRAFFGRRLPIWEGHVRDHLAELVTAVREHKGNALTITNAVLAFLDEVATGFSPSTYGKPILNEVSAGCVSRRRGKPAVLQELGRIILEQPDHRGAAKVLHRLNELIATDPAFKVVKLDYRREFWDAVRIGHFDDPDEGFAEISRRRSYTRPSPPTKAISTVHKAKGLERSDVLLMPCDAQHFSNTASARCSLYVAMSRAMRSLTFVVSKRTPSPLIAI